MEAKEQSEQKNQKTFIIVAMSTAILLVSPVITLLVLGYFLDKFFHTAPLFLLLGVSIGFISGVMNVFKLLRVTQKVKKQKAKTQLRIK